MERISWFGSNNQLHQWDLLLMVACIIDREESTGSRTEGGKMQKQESM